MRSEADKNGVRWNGDGSYTPCCIGCGWEGKARWVRADAANAVRRHSLSERHMIVVDAATVSWKPGDPCPYCGAFSVKFNGGQPKCIADGCGEFMPGPVRMIMSATIREGED